MKRKSNPNEAVFGSAVTTQEVVTPSPIIAQENTAMNAIETNVQSSVAQSAFDKARTYGDRVSVPSIDLTAEQIAQLSVRSVFENLLTSGRIRITRAANATRKDGIPVVYQNKIQMDQLARALAYVDHNIHAAWVVQDDAATRIITLLDLKGDQDRAVIGRLNANDGRIYYAPHYAWKEYNDYGQLMGVRTGDLHPIGGLIVQRANEYNGWVDAHNAAVMALAQGTATDEQRKLLGGVAVGDMAPKRFVQFNTVPHINADTIVNKYQLEAWLMLDATRPAFELYSRAKSVETMSQFLDIVVTKMEFAYRSELSKLAGLSKWVANVE